jgi:O-antigen/teichoic acid export membrane protein
VESDDAAGLGASARRRLAKEALVYGAGLTLQRGLAFLILPAATRILTPSGLGRATAALVVAGVLSNVLTLGISFAVVRLYFDEPADATRTEWAMLLRAQLLLGAALAALAWLLGPSWSGIYEDVSWSAPLKWAVVLGFAQAAQATSLAVLRAARRLTAFSSVVAAQVVLGGVLAVVLADRDGASGMVAGLAIGAIAGALLGTVLTFRPAAWSWAGLRSGFALSLPFVAHMLASWVLSLSDRVLIERYLGLAPLGRYQVAYALALVPILVTDAAQTAWLPHYYGLSEHERRTLPARLALRITLAVVAIAGVVVLIAPQLLALLAPSEFDVPALVIPLVVSVTFVRAPYLLAFGVLADAKQSRTIALASGMAAVVNVGLNVWLIPEWGLTGAAATTLIAYGLASLFASWRAEHVTGESLDLARMVVLWLAAVGVMLALSRLSPT